MIRRDLAMPAAWLQPPDANLRNATGQALVTPSDAYGPASGIAESQASLLTAPIVARGFALPASDPTCARPACTGLSSLATSSPQPSGGLKSPTAVL